MEVRPLEGSTHVFSGINVASDADIRERLSSYGEPVKHLSYGTAGFRDRYDLPLDYVFFRMGVLAALRTLSLGSKAIGAVVTASHNLEHDNGIKLVDHDGSMLSVEWEPYAAQLANCSIDDFARECRAIKTNECISDAVDTVRGGIVLIGRDTRDHSVKFSCLMGESIVLSGCRCYDIGEVTTPVLHFIVREMNERHAATGDDVDGQYWICEYFRMLSQGFVDLLSTIPQPSIQPIICSVVLDSSFGVGSITAEQFLSYYNGSFKDTVSSSVPVPEFDIDIRNRARSGRVNEGCGAEHVQKLQQPPAGVDPAADSDRLLCSFDGDGDRLVFHAFVDGHWNLLDGDKIAVLFCMLLQQELMASKLLDAYSFSVVQTAYANGASSDYLKSMGIPVFITKTGVKYLHQKAADFDVGVYFEANGHGTVLFSNRFKSDMKRLYSTGSSNDRVQLGYERLLACTALINPAVGDALSDMLFSLAALEILELDLYKWISLYTDLPSKQEKVSVPDKRLVVCSEDELTVIEPAGLQAELGVAMGRVRRGRCFVRPSGTEDVVRIYAEASTAEEVQLLTDCTRDIIRRYLG